MYPRLDSASLFSMLLGVIFLTLLGGCSAFSGYPRNYQSDSAVLDADQPYLSANVRTIGNAQSDSERGGLSQQQYRDTVVYRRLEVIDIFYYDFESKLVGSYNGLDAGADLTGLILNGLGATTGSATTKAALAAASAGVIGAKATVNTDLFYQKTLPALVSEMRAGRQTALVPIKAGLTQPVTKYSIDQALGDVNTYYVAGTLPSAVQQVTAQAGAATASANDALAAIRSSTYAAPTDTAKRIIAWLFPNGDQTKPPITANVTQLSQWMGNDKVDTKLNGVPYILLLNTSAFPESDRTRAIQQLNIP